MSTMFIRVTRDGTIYPFNEYLARNPECEVIAEEIAYPERFIPEHAAERVEDSQKPKVGRKKKAALDLTTADIPEEPTYTPPELATEAARGMP